MVGRKRQRRGPPTFAQTVANNNENDYPPLPNLYRQNENENQVAYDGDSEDSLQPGQQNFKNTEESENEDSDPVNTDGEHGSSETTIVSDSNKQNPPLA